MYEFAWTTPQHGGPELEFDDQVLGRLAVAVLRSAAIRHREVLATTGASPGLVPLLTDSFAAVARLTSSTSGAEKNH